MSELLASIEERRLKAGLSQAAVARAVGISQPHYSKVVGGLARLPADLEARLVAWAANQEVAQADGYRAELLDAVRLRAIAASIETQLVELNRLLGVANSGRRTRVPRPTAQRRRPSS